MRRIRNSPREKQEHPVDQPVDQEKQSIARFKEQAALVRQTLRGYAHAATVIERERMERLARMTQEEASAIYDDLCQSWKSQTRANDSERLKQWRIETLLAVRAAMARLSRKLEDE